MSVKTLKSDIPLCVLGLLCFLTIFMSQMRLTISKSPEPVFDRTQNNWTVWNYSKPKVYGTFLKAVIMISAPLFSLASTLLLLTGINKKNFYFFLPWILITCKGLLSIQTLNFWEVFQLLVEYHRLSEVANGDWIMLCMYVVVVLFFDVVEGFCCLEVLCLFRSFWKVDQDLKNKKDLEDDEILDEDCLKLVS